MLSQLFDKAIKAWRMHPEYDRCVPAVGLRRLEPEVAPLREGQREIQKVLYIITEEHI